MDIQIGDTILTHGQIAVVEDISNDGWTIYLEHAVVVPDIAYTRDIITKDEVIEVMIHKTD